MEAMNHYNKRLGFHNIGEHHYLVKEGSVQNIENIWYQFSSKIVDIEFYDREFSSNPGTGETKGHFYFRSAYRNEPDFQINSMHRQNNPIDSIRVSTLIQNDQTVSENYQRLVANTISGVFDPGFS